MLDSYNKYKKETQVIVGISAIPIGRIRMTNQVLTGRVPYALIPLCTVDHLAQGLMKNGANSEMLCELQNT